MFSLNSSGVVFSFANICEPSELVKILEIRFRLSHSYTCKESLMGNKAEALFLMGLIINSASTIAPFSEMYFNCLMKGKSTRQATPVPDWTKALLLVNSLDNLPLESGKFLIIAPVLSKEMLLNCLETSAIVKSFV